MLELLIREQCWSLVCLPITLGAQLDKLTAETYGEGIFHKGALTLLELALQTAPTPIASMMTQALKHQIDLRADDRQAEPGQSENDGTPEAPQYVTKAEGMFKIAGAESLLTAWREEHEASLVKETAEQVSELLNRALVSAAYGNQLEAANQLLEWGANPNAMDPDRPTAVSAATLAGHPDMLHLLTGS